MPFLNSLYPHPPDTCAISNLPQLIHFLLKGALLLVSLAICHPAMSFPSLPTAPCPLHAEVVEHSDSRCPVSFGSCKLRFPTTPLKCTRTHRTPSAAPEARPSAPGLKEGPHTPPHNANQNARREAGSGRRGRDSPFCSLSLESCNLLLRLDSARVPVLWPARADVSRRRPRRSIWLTGARAHSRRALGKRRVRGSAQPG